MIVLPCKRDVGSTSLLVLHRLNSNLALQDKSIAAGLSLAIVGHVHLIKEVRKISCKVNDRVSLVDFHYGNTSTTLPCYIHRCILQRQKFG